MQGSIFSKIIRRFRDVAGALHDCRRGKNTRLMALDATWVFPPNRNISTGRTTGMNPLQTQAPAKHSPEAKMRTAAAAAGAFDSAEMI